MKGEENNYATYKTHVTDWKGIWIKGVTAIGTRKGEGYGKTQRGRNLE